MLDQPEYLFATITTVKELFLVLLGAGGGMPIVFDLEAILFVLVMERVFCRLMYLESIIL